MAVVVLSSCEKDIDISFHEVEPIYVVEGSLYNSGMRVRLSTTNNMDDNSGDSELSYATITVSSTDGSESYSLTHISNGIYRNYGIRPVAGREYRLDVDINGRHFSSTSTMQRAPKVNNFRLVWMEVASQRICFGDLRLQDFANETNYYFLHIYRNGLGYRWAVMKDTNAPGKELQQLFTFYREGSDNSDVLQEGDVLHLDIRTIDQRAYDYLYSMQLMDDTGTNPIANFTGGCLGYFSAYGQTTQDVVFHAADIETDK